MSAQVAYLGTSIADWVGELSSSDPLQRRLGAYALGEIGPAATEAVSDLAAALQDPVGFVRVWAAAALARVAPPGGESVTVLIAELGNELAFVRSLAALADWPPEKLNEAKGSGSLLEASEVASVVIFTLTRPRGMTIRDVDGVRRCPLKCPVFGVKQKSCTRSEPNRF
jgi:hypothetical protein